MTGLLELLALADEVKELEGLDLVVTAVVRGDTGDSDCVVEVGVWTSKNKVGPITVLASIGLEIYEFNSQCRKSQSAHPTTSME